MTDDQKHLPSDPPHQTQVEADFWTARNNLSNLSLAGRGVAENKGDLVWDFAAQEWTNADTPLYAAPPSLQMEVERLRRMVERRDEFIIGKGIWDQFKEASREAE